MWVYIAAPFVLLVIVAIPIIASEIRIYSEKKNKTENKQN